MTAHCAARHLELDAPRPQATACGFDAPNGALELSEQLSVERLAGADAFQQIQQGRA